MSKNDYLQDYVKRFNEKVPEANQDAKLNLNDLSKEEKNELYQRYVENSKFEKEHFIMQKYLEKEKKLPILEKHTLAERIEAENKRLAMMEKAYGEKTVEKEKKVDAPEAKQEATKNSQAQGKISVNLDEEEHEIQEKEEQIDEKKEVVKEVEKENEIDGTRIDIEIDEEVEEMNNDILNFNGEKKELNKDQQIKV